MNLKVIFIKQIRFYLCLLLTLCACLRADAQFYNTGTDPARLKWNKVKLTHYNLIYNQGNDSAAYRYALYLENVYPHLNKTLGKVSPKRFTVVLHPDNLLSNGLVVWAPKRMELYSTPTIAPDVTPWEKHLAVHESRHVFQTSNMLQGVFKPFYYILGEQVVGIASFLAPIWFLEGDAVCTETAMTNGGRGRQPRFNMIQRTQMLTDSIFYPRNKWLLGSYKDQTGSFYTLGYNLTAFARQKYGSEVWKKTSQRFTRNLFFERAFKKTTGTHMKRHYKETYAYLREVWRKQDTITPQAVTYWSRMPRRYTSFSSPTVADDSTVFAIKNSMTDIASLVRLRPEGEKHITYLGNINGQIAYKDSCIYWAEYRPHVRWEHEKYSVLMCYSLKEHGKKRVSHENKILQWAICQSAPLLATSQYTETGENLLRVMHTDTEEQVAQWALPQHRFIKDFIFLDDTRLVVEISGNDGLTLFYADISTGEWEKLYHSDEQEINQLATDGKDVYFSSGLNGIDNIYRLDLHTKVIEQLTQARFGAFEPMYHQGRLYFADYQAKGYRIASLPIKQTLQRVVDFSKDIQLPFVDMLAEQENFNLEEERMDSITFQPQKYRKIGHLFRVHSWAPFYYNVTEALQSDLSKLVRPGATILAQNSLSTLTLQAGWYVDQHHHHGILTMRYSGWYPIIDVNVDYGDKAYALIWEKGNDQNWTRRYKPTQKNKIDVHAQLSIPLNYSNGQRIRSIQPAISYQFTNNALQDTLGRRTGYTQLLEGEVRLLDYRRKAASNILPRNGYMLTLKTVHFPFQSNSFGSLYAARLAVYFPGILRTHGGIIKAGYQYQDLNGRSMYAPLKLISTARGCQENMLTRHVATVSVDYAFPIITPDWDLGTFAYIRRLRANVFYDHAFNQTSRGKRWTSQNSCGLDLLFDWNFLRKPYPINTGVRLMLPLNGEKFKAQLLFSISI